MKHSRSPSRDMQYASDFVKRMCSQCFALWCKLQQNRVFNLSVANEDLWSIHEI